MTQKQNLVSIDGIYYDIVIPTDGIKRSFSIADTENSGRLLNGKMIRDLVGTYYNYTIQFETKYMSAEEYDDLYTKLSAPVEYHTLTVPYGQESLTFQAYVTSGNDSIKTVVNGIRKWHGLSVNFIAEKPERTPLTG
ncbi:MAG: hypothetical protein J1F01_05700 [Oscillospiraceae bacterium]|nr:hypothetical protein [Oscillospiraceae bacterium]